jgi:hypothetical protein
VGGLRPSATPAAKGEHRSWGAAVAAEVARHPFAAAPFDRDIVPALARWALEGVRPGPALAAVSILGVAMTAASRRALAAIAANAVEAVAAAARAALDGGEGG